MLDTSPSWTAKNASFASRERAQTRFLLVDQDRYNRQSLKQCLLGLGYGSIAEVGEPTTALEKIEEHPYTHIVFEPLNSPIRVDNFIRIVSDLQPDTIILTLLSEPSVDDVFQMLAAGAKGFLVKPYSVSSIDEAIITASVVENIPDVILQADNHTEALTSLILVALDKLATIKRQARKFATAEHEIPKRRLALSRAIQLANQFLDCDTETFHNIIIELCSERAIPVDEETSKALLRLREKKGNSNRTRAYS